MVTDFNISIYKKSVYDLYITGYSKYFFWKFPTAIRIQWNINPYRPRLKERYSFTSVLKINQSIKNGILKIKARFNLSSQLKVIQRITVRTLERFLFKTSFKLSQRINAIRERLRLIRTVFDPIKVKMTGKLAIVIFYKLMDWDYKIPDQPLTSPKYTLSELDGKTLASMDIKTRITT